LVHLKGYLRVAFYVNAVHELLYLCCVALLRPDMNHLTLHSVGIISVTNIRFIKPKNLLRN